MSYLVRFETAVIDVERIVLAALGEDSVTLVLDGLDAPVDFEGKEAEAIGHYLMTGTTKKTA